MSITPTKTRNKSKTGIGRGEPLRPVAPQTAKAAITTKTEKTEAAHPVFPFWWRAWLILLLVLFAAPSFVARVIHLRGDEPRAIMLQGKTLDDNSLLRVYESRRWTASWFRDNDAYNDLAMAAMALSMRTQGDTAQRMMQEAEYWQRMALSVTPADAYGWYRLAYMHYAAKGASSVVAAAWRQSMASAPFELRLIFPRLEMAMGVGPYMETEWARFYLPSLIRDAWNDHPDRLADLAVKGAYVSVVEDALRNDPVASEAFRVKVRERTPSTQ